MRSRASRISLLTVGLLISCFHAGLEATGMESDWQNLFAGNSLDQWDTWLRATESDGGEHGTPIGLNQDPLNVFTMQDNGILRVSGQVFGCISSKESFKDYQIKWQFRWGEKKWPPREQQLRDSGFLYHCQGKHGAFWNAWKSCLEYQIQEGDVGDLIFLAGPYGKTRLDASYRSTGPGLYDPLGPIVKAPRTRHSGQHESPHGEWNSCQAIVRGNGGVHIVNGYVVNRVYDLTINRENGPQPLVEGQLQFQSEAAELFYRNMYLRELPAEPQAGLEAIEASVSSGSVTYINRGFKSASIAAIELLGQYAQDFKLTIPQFPLDLAAGESMEVSYRYRGKSQPGDTVEPTVVLRLEGLGGPAENTRVVLKP